MLIILVQLSLCKFVSIFFVYGSVGLIFVCIFGIHVDEWILFIIMATITVYFLFFSFGATVATINNYENPGKKDKKSITIFVLECHHNDQQPQFISSSLQHWPSLAESLNYSMVLQLMVYAYKTKEQEKGA